MKKTAFIGKGCISASKIRKKVLREGRWRMERNLVSFLLLPFFLLAKKPFQTNAEGLLKL